MDGVGTRQGYVHDQRQGTGLATVLTGGDYAAGLWIAGAHAGKAQKDAARQARDKAAMDAIKSMTDFNPEFWYAHDAEMKQQLNSWQDKGTQLLQSGVDPWSSLDPQSVEWRKNYSRIQQMSTYSKQIKADFDNTRTQIDGKTQDFYTAESLVERKKFFDQPVSQTLDTGVKPPQLIERTPFVNRHEYWSKVMKTRAEQNPGVTLDDAQLAETGKAALQEPESGPKLASSYQSALALMEADDRSALEKRAADAGRTNFEQMAFEDAKREQINLAPFDVVKFVESGSKQTEVSTTTFTGPKGGSSKVDMKKLEESAALAARRIVMDDPRALKHYDKPGLVPRNGDDDAEYQKRVIEYVKEEIIKTKKLDQSAMQTERGLGDAELKTSGELWLKHMMSADKQFYNEAAGYLYLGGGYIGNMNILNSKVVEKMKDNKPYRELEISLEGSPMLKKEGGAGGADDLFGGPADQKAAVEKAVKDAGIEGAEYVQMGTEKKLIVPITINTENQLLKVHDLAFNHNKKPYTGAKTLPKYQWPGGTAKRNPETPPPGDWRQ